MQGSSHAYYNPNQNTSIPSWGTPAHPSWSTPPPWSFSPQHHSQPTRVISAIYSATTSVECTTPGVEAPHTTMLQIYFLHHLLNHNFYTLLHLNNLRCLPSQIRTRKTNKHNKCTMERHPILLMLWRFRKSTKIWESTHKQPNSTST